MQKIAAFATEKSGGFFMEFFQTIAKRRISYPKGAAALVE
ncbi:hypothetical protein EDC45_1647 [Mesocricetibacter intestinalis]|uniref:Uncharacterized protein n=1 Tax=Mesocricetibacter intestinalis TaxID=1521930 RepID=A0A4R6VAA6_9PAST|nr:hypothetical protein EDC45_1647 [Mesocricetibacter intestinalis]